MLKRGSIETARERERERERVEWERVSNMKRHRKVKERQTQENQWT